jgi:COMPASS component SWD2
LLTAPKAPFAHGSLVDLGLNGAATPKFTSLAFSNNGEYILVGTSGSVHYVLDAFDLVILRRLEGHQQGLNRLSGEEVCWTADSNWVMSGCPDGSIVAWDLTPPNGSAKLKAVTGRDEPAPTLHPASVLRPSGEGHAVSRAVRFNPRYAMLAVGGEELVSFLVLRKSVAADSA